MSSALFLRDMSVRSVAQGPRDESGYQIEQEVTLQQLVGGGARWLAANLKWMLIGVVVGAIAGVTYGLVTPKYYAALMVGYPQNINDVRIKELVSDLQNLIMVNDQATLAQNLRITPEQARQMRKLRTLWHEALETELPTYPPRPAERRFVGIELTTAKPEIAPLVGERLMEYIDMNPLSVRLLPLQRANAERMIRDCQDEIAYLELAKGDQRGLMGRQGSYIGDPGAISVHKLELGQRISEESEKLALARHELVLIKPMIASLKPVTPGPYRAGLTGAIYGLLISLLGLLLHGLAGFARQPK